MAAHIALHEVHAKFRTKRVTIGRRDLDPPEFAGLNPQTKVPTLVLEDGQVLTEVAGVLYYLARAYPEAKLFPFGDIKAEAHVISWMSFVASGIHPARREGEDHARMIWGLADRRLGDREWAVGDYSIADIHLFRLYWRFGRFLGGDDGAYPSLARHFGQMMDRPAVKKTLAAEEAEGYALP
jgi:glutathione S-transferase